MENENRILEVLVDSLRAQDRMAEQLVRITGQLDGVNDELKGVNGQLNSINDELRGVNRRLEILETKSDRAEARFAKVEDQLVKLNLQTSENNRAIFKLAENVAQIADLHNRVFKLEKAVFK